MDKKEGRWKGVRAQKRVLKGRGGGVEGGRLRKMKGGWEGEVESESAEMRERKLKSCGKERGKG